MVGRDECYLCMCVLGKLSPGVWVHESSTGGSWVTPLLPLPHHHASPTLLPTRTSFLQSLHLGLEWSMSHSGPPAGGISPGTRLLPVPCYRLASSQALSCGLHLLPAQRWTPNHMVRWGRLGRRHSSEWLIIFRTWYPQGRTWDIWQFRISMTIMWNFWYPNLLVLKQNWPTCDQKENKQRHSSPRVQGFSHCLLQFPTNRAPWEDFRMRCSVLWIIRPQDA